jgi:pimeloyl-ACP methyl ester carboxylesterase
MRPRLVLIPGMLCDAALFASLVKALGDAIDCRIVDLKGLNSIEAMAARAIAASEGKPFIVAGLSMGGLAAMEVMRQNPACLKGVILMAIGQRGSTDGFRTMRLEQMERARKGELRHIVVDEMKLMFLGPRYQSDQAMIDQVIGMAMRAGVEAFIDQSEALMNRIDYTETLQGLTLPTLILCGSEDKLIPPKHHAAMAALMPGCKLVELPDTGHLLSMEAPNEVAGEITQFIATQLA